LGDLEFYLITLLQAFVTFGSYRAVMHENIGATITSNKAVTLSIIEPLHRTFQTFHLTPPRHVPYRSEVVPFIEAILRLANRSVKTDDHQKTCIFGRYRY